MINRTIIIAAGAALAMAFGIMTAYAHQTAPTSSAVAVHSDQAVWMTIQLADGNISTALTYDGVMATVSHASRSSPSNMQGWGFLPVIRTDGSVMVKVYKLSFVKKGASFKMKGNAQYLETLSPKPSAETTQSGDEGITVKIVKTGPVNVLKNEFLKMKSAQRAAYLKAHGNVQAALIAKNGPPAKLIVPEEQDCCSICPNGPTVCASVSACCTDGYCCTAS